MSVAGECAHRLEWKGAKGTMEEMTVRDRGIIICSTVRAWMRRGLWICRWTWNGSARRGTVRQTCREIGLWRDRQEDLGSSMCEKLMTGGGEDGEEKNGTLATSEEEREMRKNAWQTQTEQGAMWGEMGRFSSKGEPAGLWGLRMSETSELFHCSVTNMVKSAAAY